MPIIRIDDAADPRIADYRNVPDPVLLRRRGLFVAENRLVVRPLLASARFRALSVLVTDAAYAALRDDLAPFEPTLPIYVCAKSLMEPVSGYNIHRGCLALGVRPDPQSVSDLLAALGHARRASERSGAMGPQAPQRGCRAGDPAQERTSLTGCRGPRHSNNERSGAMGPQAPQRGCRAGDPAQERTSLAGCRGPRHSNRLVVLEGITNADNVGAVFRNARAFGADGIVVGPGCCDPLYRKAIRVSIGATLEVPYACVGPPGFSPVATHVGPPGFSPVATHVGPPGFSPVADRGAPPATAWPADLLELERAGFTVVALTPAGDAVDLDTFASGPLPDKIALLVGNEGEGLSAGAQGASDVRVRIVMAPGVDSLNVSTATGIALYRMSRVGS
jgi:tRNA G18 (ribose-2'-O)-methylase SpoU